ncbi:MAG: hypothetical protein KJI71_00070 [Patescibacteria group bacterium]|nr:hypothetical protein [Patescibacteria group bacterium]
MLEIILLVLFTILFITTNIEFYKLIVELLRNFIILTSVVTALTIPFVMKDIEEKKREVELRDRIETVINELKNYFEIIISSKFEELPKKNLYIHPQFQFFKSIGRKEPEFLKKLGIDISSYTSTSRSGTQSEGGSLIILNIYRLRGGYQPTLIFISTENEFSDLPDSYEILLKKIIENAEKFFSVTLDKNLCSLSDDLKSGYLEVTKR